MTDATRRARLSGALDKLRADLLKDADDAGLSPNSAYRAMVEKTIGTLRRQLKHDLSGLENELRAHARFSKKPNSP